MEQRSTTCELLSPAFLGDANQRAAWRTPPFKAQLRRWWRVAMWARAVRLPELRTIEGYLFGDAAGQSDRKSRVRIRLENWSQDYGNLWLSQADSSALRTRGGPDAVTYLAFGRANTKGANNSAIPAREAVEFHIAWPGEAEGGQAVPEALGLIHRLAALGGRSNNGWGSFHLTNVPEIDLNDYSRAWNSAIDEPWVHAVGRDEQGPLVWQTAHTHASWEGVMRDLADIRKRLCGEAGPLRPLMSWPVTGINRHGEMGPQDRIPNTLRLRVIRVGRDQLHGQVTHLPCRPADEIWHDNDRRNYPKLWQRAHQLLDNRADLERVSR
jgi:CRISPR-associated protein Cmr1